MGEPVALGGGQQELLGYANGQYMSDWSFTLTQRAHDIPLLWYRQLQEWAAIYARNGTLLCTEMGGNANHLHIQAVLVLPVPGTRENFIEGWVQRSGTI